MRHTVLLLVLLLLVPAARAQEDAVAGDLLVYNVWVEPTTTGADTRLHMTIENHTSSDVRFIRAQSGELTSTVLFEEGTVALWLTIPAGETLTLEGTQHTFLLMGVSRALELDDTLALMLDFALGEDERVLIPVAAVVREEPPPESTLVVANAWARPTALAEDADSVDVAGVISGVYLVVENRGDDPVRLVSVEGQGVGFVQFHETQMENNVMRMRPVMDFEVPPGERLTLEPGGRHLMLNDLEAHLIPGSALVLTLKFDTGDVMIAVPVRDESADTEHDH